MGIVSAFVLGCLVTAWWKAKANQKVSSREVETVKPEGSGYVEIAKSGLRNAVLRVTEIRSARIPKQPVTDEELKDMLLGYAIDQVRKGKIRIVEDID